MEDVAEAERLVTLLMGDKVEPRQRLYQRHTPILTRRIHSWHETGKAK